MGTVNSVSLGCSVPSQAEKPKPKHGHPLSALASLRRFLGRIRTRQPCKEAKLKQQEPRQPQAVAAIAGAEDDFANHGEI